MIIDTHEAFKASAWYKALKAQHLETPYHSQLLLPLVYPYYSIRVVYYYNFTVTRGHNSHSVCISHKIVHRCVGYILYWQQIFVANSHYLYKALFCSSSCLPTGCAIPIKAYSTDILMGNVYDGCFCEYIAMSLII